MKRIFLGLAAFNILLFVGVVALGFGVMTNRPQYFTVHFLFGLFTTLYTTFVQSLVFVYFLGTGKWIKDAVAGRAGEAEIVARTKKLKAMSFGVATYSALLIVVAAILGAAADVGFVPAWVHGVASALAVGLNIFSYFPEAKAIGLNAQLLDDAEAVAANNPVLS